jgi:hypothetical protein
MTETLVLVARLEIWFILVGLFSVVGYQMLTGKINVRGLLTDREDGTFSTIRAQLLLSTILGAVYFLAQVAQGIAQDPPKLPEVSEELLIALGGSNTVHLLAKGRNLLAGIFKQ